MKLTDKSLSDLRKLITSSFSDEEIRSLCFDLGIDYEDVGGTTKSSKARELISLLIREGRLDEMLSECVKQRPNLGWERFYHTSGFPIPTKMFSQPVDINQSNSDRHTHTASQSRSMTPLWIILIAIPLSWFAGQIISLYLVDATSSSLVILGTAGGTLCSLLIAWFGLVLTNSAIYITFGQLTRITICFLLAGLMGGFFGLAMWLFGCAFDPISLVGELLGCNETSKLLWKLGAVSGSAFGLLGASIVMLLELGFTRLKYQKGKS